MKQVIIVLIVICAGFFYTFNALNQFQQALPRVMGVK